MASTTLYSAWEIRCYNNTNTNANFWVDVLFENYPHPELSTLIALGEGEA